MLGGLLQLVVGPSAVAHVLRIEHGQMLADDLVGRVALDALRPDVPGGHLAVDVQHEDRVFAHAFHQQAETLLALAQLLLMAASLREVAGDLREADQRAALVAHGRDDGVGPEQRTILADAPAFVLVRPEAFGDLQLMRGQAALERLGRIEAREVAADDLVGAIALEAFRAGVPGEDVAVGIEHEDRVVEHALHEQAKAFLALAQVFGPPRHALAVCVHCTSCGVCVRLPAGAERMIVHRRQSVCRLSSCRDLGAPGRASTG